MEELGRLQSVGLQRVGHDWATSLHFTIYDIDIKNLLYSKHKELYSIFWNGLYGKRIHTHTQSRYMYMSNWFTLLYTWKKTQHCKSSMLQKNWKPYLSLGVRGCCIFLTFKRKRYMSFLVVKWQSNGNISNHSKNFLSTEHFSSADCSYFLTDSNTTFTWKWHAVFISSNISTR